MLPQASNIPIDPALTSYRAQSVVLPSTEASYPLGVGEGVGESEGPTTTARSATASLKPKRPRGSRLTEDEDLILIQLCLKNELAYGIERGNTKFWNTIRVQFAKETGQDYTKPKRHLDDLINKRKIHLAMIGTGDEEDENTYTRALDDWMKVVDTHDNEATKKKDTAKQQANKIQKEEKIRDNLMQRMGKKRSYQTSSESSSESGSEEIEMDSPSLPTQSRSASRTPTASIRSNSEHRPKRARQYRPSRLGAADSDPMGVAGLGAAMLRFVEVMTAQEEAEQRQRGRRRQAGQQQQQEEEEEATKRAITANKAAPSQAERLDNLEKNVSAILSLVTKMGKEKE